MNPYLPYAIAGSFGVLSTVVLWLLIRRLQRMSGKPVDVGPAEILPVHHCPNCKQEMTAGYAVALRGIIFRRSDELPTSSLVTTFKALRNTLSTGIPIAENRAWHCIPCSLLLLDHSQLVRTRR